jgi:two-component system CheB/CheR fusion protein
MVDGDGHIVHIHGEAGRFLRYTDGTPTHELLNVIDPELRLELRIALFQAGRSGRSVESRRVHVKREGQDRFVRMIVRPVLEEGVGQPLVMVMFDEVDGAMLTHELRDERHGDDPLVNQLEEELRRVKEQLQSTIEQSDSSTEELQASNEELQAINQELRSATEELETSKEELQSINEELITVNHELKCKVEEAGKINDDLQNLIASVDIASVFVDRQLAVKRYTPRASKLFNLIPSDVGRSLTDITHKLDYPALAADAMNSFEKLRHIEREVRGKEGQWFVARMLPYRTTEDHRIDGAVLTFVDITSRRNAEEMVRRLTAGLTENSPPVLAPLNLIHLSTSMLRNPKALPLAARIIRNGVLAQARIVDSLVDLSREDAEVLLLERSRFDLREHVDQLVEALQGWADLRRVTLRLKRGSRPVWVHADRLRIHQVVWNLIDNAVRNTPPRGHVTLSVRGARQRASVQVADTGHGIDAGRLPHIFDIARLDMDTRYRPGARLGIGLALSRQLALLHDGYIEAASAGPGRGACFTLVLPLSWEAGK